MILEQSNLFYYYIFFFKNTFCPFFFFGSSSALKKRLVDLWLHGLATERPVGPNFTSVWACGSFIHLFFTKNKNKRASHHNEVKSAVQISSTSWQHNSCRSVDVLKAKDENWEKFERRTWMMTCGLHMGNQSA